LEVLPFGFAHAGDVDFAGVLVVEVFKRGNGNGLGLVP
jgi:hypothetical protein